MIKRVDNGGLVHLVTNIRKPRKWRRYEWIQSANDRLYIDTGILLSLNFKYLITFYLSSTSSTARVCGYRNTSDTSTGSILMINYPSSNQGFINAFNWYYTGTDAFTNTGKYTVSISNTEIIINGSMKKSYNTINYILPTVTFFIFGYNNAGNVYEEGVLYTKIYEFKLWESDTLVRDMVPAEYNGLYGMWDLVEDKFYGNAGTGTFTVGPEIKNYDEIDEVRKTTSLLPSGVELYDYILSSGTLWIDTGYLMNGDNHEINIDALQGTTSETIYGFQATTLLCTLYQGDIYWNGATTYGTNRSKNIGVASTFTSRFTLNIKANNGTINYKLNSTTGSYTCGYTNFSGVQHNMHLFASNYYNNDHRYSTGKVYSFTIKLGGNLVRNFLPCTYLGEPGMWDTVENKFYRNQGTGQFTLGNKIALKEYEYLLGDGNAYIDTNWLPAQNFEILAKFEKTVDALDKCPFGSRVLAADSTCILLFDDMTSSNNGSRIWVGNKCFYSPSKFNTITFGYNGYAYCRTNTFNFPDDISNRTASTVAIKIFACNSLWIYNGKIYYFKGYDNGKLVRDFIPVSYNGTPGLWDKVEWKFYGNAGSGSFTLGPEKSNGIYPVWINDTNNSTFSKRITDNGKKVRRLLAYIKGIKGNSVAFNLLNLLLFINSNRVTLDTSVIGEYKYIYNTTETTSNRYIYTNNISIPTNHKVAIYLKLKSNFTNKPYFRYAVSSGNYASAELRNPYVKNCWNDIGVISNGFLAGSTSGILPAGNNYIADEYIIFSHPNPIKVFDLTLMYGNGKEPNTFEEFELDYIEWFGTSMDQLEYTVSTLFSSKALSISTLNENLWNNNLISLASNSSITVDQDNSLTVSTRGYQENYNRIKLPFKNYNYNILFDSTVLSKTDDRAECSFVINYVDGTTLSNNIITGTPVNSTKHVSLNTTKVISDIYFGCWRYGGVCKISNIDIRVTGLKYSDANYTLNKVLCTENIEVTSFTGKLNGAGNSIIIFPNGMKRIDTIYDEIKIEQGVTKAIKRIGEIVLTGSEPFIMYYDSYFKQDSTNMALSTYTTDTINTSYIPRCNKLVGQRFALPIWNGTGYENTICYNSNIQIHMNISNSLTGAVYGTDNVATAKTKFINYISNLYNAGTPFVIYYVMTTPEEYILDNYTLPQLIIVLQGGIELIILDTNSIAPELAIEYIT